MESFNVKSDLIELEKLKRFGNIYFFNMGFNVFNLKGIGIYCTLIIIVLSDIFSCLIINEFTDHILLKKNKNILILILSFSSTITFFLCVYVSIKNPGFYKPFIQEEKDELNNNTVYLVNFNGSKTILKICKTCRILKKLRVFHCKYCNLCVNRHDHHCPWLSVCIGKDNHKRFLFLILYSIIHSFGFFSVLIHFIINYSHELKKQGLDLFWGCLIILMFSGFVGLFLILLFYHQILFITQDITTSEYLRMDKYKANLFDDGCKKNISKFIDDEDSYEEFLIYNDSAKDAISRVFLIENYLKRSLKKKIGEKICTKVNEDNTEEIEKKDTIDQTLQSQNEYFNRQNSDSLDNKIFTKSTV